MESNLPTRSDSMPALAVADATAPVSSPVKVDVGVAAKADHSFERKRHSLPICGELRQTIVL